MNIHWNQVMAEFHQMAPFDQLRAVNKAQMEWLAENSENVPFKEALDLGFGCGFSAVAMMKGGCKVTCVNYEGADVVRRVEAEQRYERICGEKPKIIGAPTDRALPRLLDDGRKFGLIFVDAGHRFDDVFIDVHYAKSLCVPGGILALDDTYYGAIKSAANWIISNLGHIWQPYQILENTISWKRTAAEADDWLQEITHRSHPGPPNRFEVATENADELKTTCGFVTWKPTLNLSSD